LDLHTRHATLEPAEERTRILSTILGWRSDELSAGTHTRQLVEQQVKNIVDQAAPVASVGQDDCCHSVAWRHPQHRHCSDGVAAMLDKLTSLEPPSEPMNAVGTIERRVSDLFPPHQLCRLLRQHN
jgi:hypothetical protein